MLDSADMGRLRPRWDGARLPEPQRQHPRAAASHAMQPIRQRQNASISSLSVPDPACPDARP